MSITFPRNDNNNNNDNDDKKNPHQKNQLI